MTHTRFRDGDNVDYELTPRQIMTMWQESAAYVSAIYQGVMDIKAMDPDPGGSPLAIAGITGERAALVLRP